LVSHVEIIKYVSEIDPDTTTGRATRVAIGNVEEVIEIVRTTEQKYQIKTTKIN